MSFFRTSLWGGLSTGITMLCGLVTTKYVAVMIGPEGMAYVGQFTNITMLVALLATGACGNGIVKYLAEHKEPEERRKILANAFLLAGLCMVVCTIGLVYFADILSKQAFGAESYRSVFIIYGLLLVFPTFNAIANAVFVGLQQVRLMSLIGVGAALINLVSVLVAARYFGVKGVLLANIVASFFAFFVYAIALRRSGLLHLRKFTSLYSKRSVQQLLGFSAMAIVSGVVAPSLQLIVRSKLLHNFDANTAGLWQANTRLSDYYLNFIYTVLGIYYLPRLSEIKDPLELKKEVRLGYLRILPPVILITLAIWFFREWIVTVFLTARFKDMLVLLKWQLIGDVVKIASWILGYLLIARAMKKSFIGTELIFSTSFVLLNFWFINQFGMVGTVYAFTLNSSLYLLTLIVYLRKTIF